MSRISQFISKENLWFKDVGQVLKYIVQAWIYVREDSVFFRVGEIPGK